jgi:hypothetical protein
LIDYFGIALPDGSHNILMAECDHLFLDYFKNLLGIQILGDSISYLGSLVAPVKLSAGNYHNHQKIKNQRQKKYELR